MPVRGRTGSGKLGGSGKALNEQRSTRGLGERESWWTRGGGLGLRWGVNVERRFVHHAVGQRLARVVTRSNGRGVDLPRGTEFGIHEAFSIDVSRSHCNRQCGDRANPQGSWGPHSRPWRFSDVEPANDLG